MTASIQLQHTPQLQYLLRLGDTCLILGQRLGEWCGHGPVLEEDIALANMALDLIGQARACSPAPARPKAVPSTKTSWPSCATSATTATPRWWSCRVATLPSPCSAT